MARSKSSRRTASTVGGCLRIMWQKTALLKLPRPSSGKRSRKKANNLSVLPFTLACRAARCTHQPVSPRHVLLPVSHSHQAALYTLTIAGGRQGAGRGRGGGGEGGRGTLNVILDVRHHLVGISQPNHRFSDARNDFLFIRFSGLLGVRKPRKRVEAHFLPPVSRRHHHARATARRRKQQASGRDGRCLLQQRTTSKSKHAPIATAHDQQVKARAKTLATPPAGTPPQFPQRSRWIPPSARAHAHTYTPRADRRARTPPKTFLQHLGENRNAVLGRRALVYLTEPRQCCLWHRLLSVCQCCAPPPPPNATYAHTHPCRGVRTCQRRGGSPLRPSTLRAQPQRAMPPRTAKDRRASPFSTAQHRRGAAPAGYTAEAYQCA